MEVGEQLKELNMTVDEIDKFTRAFKDEKFRGLLLDYANELSDPENKKKYEEEIKLLEQERGNSIDFIHPTPFRALRTSLNGKQKCFINICANEKVGKPEFNWGVSDDGRRGQRWSLPHSLHPGRQDRDPKGNEFMIYDVIFHPDTLHIASRNKRFMDVVDNTAIKGIQDAFNVILDKNNVREMTVKYKGTLKPCVIRKPIPGYKAKAPPAQPDPLAFPYPNEERPTTAPTTEPTEAPRIKDSGDAKPLTFQTQPQKPKQPTMPNYTLKYRSFTDLQDFRYSRDSAQSPRPKEIMVTIDMPLLKSATDTSLEVKGKSLLLESKEPAYRLEVPLGYPVDEDKGEAKFNKQKRQLTITLPVLPSNETFDFVVGPSQTVSDNEREEEEENGGEGEEKWKEHKSEGERNEEEEENGVEKKLKEQKRDEGEKIGVEEEEKWKEQKQEEAEQRQEGQISEEGEEIGVEEEKWKEQKREGEKSEEQEGSEQWEIEKSKDRDDARRGGAAQTEDSCVSGLQWDTAVQYTGLSTEDKNSAPNTENQSISPLKNELAELSRGIEVEGGANMDSCFKSRAQMKTCGETGMTQENADYLKGNMNEVEKGPSFLNQMASDKSQATAAASAIPGTPLSSNQNTNEAEDCSMSKAMKEIRDAPVPNKAKMSRRRNPSKRSDHLEREDTDENDLTTGQTFPVPDHNSKPPPALLMEIDEDRNVMVISDHSTSAGFTFQNSLLYELD